VHRRNVLLGGSGATIVGLLDTLLRPNAALAEQSATDTIPGPGPFEGSTVRRLARALAQQRYKAPPTDLPGPINSLSYDQYRTIQFRKERSLWRDRKLPFEVEFFPRGFLFRPAVDIFEVADGKATAVPYSVDLFNYEEPALRVPGDLGFAGFRIHTPAASSDDSDELCSFLGASYFRAITKGQHYGLSARGLAIGTGNPKGEEFARFRAFWLERPKADAPALVLPPLLALQRAETADGQGAKGELCPCFPGFLPEHGAHTDGELMNSNAAQPCGDEMPPLMGGNQDAKEEDGKDNIHTNYASFLRIVLRCGAGQTADSFSGPPVCFQYILQGGI